MLSATRAGRPQEEAKSGGLPLSHYYHPAEGKADLSKFDPRAWLHASRNGGEATVYFANVTAGLPLDPASPAFLQVSPAPLPAWGAFAACLAPQ